MSQATTIKTPSGKTVSKAEIKKELAYRGKLRFRLHKGQKKVYDLLNGNLANPFVIRCSRQFGKTDFLSTVSHEVGLKKVKGKIKYGAPTLEDAEEFVLPAFEKVARDIPTAIRPKYKPSENKVVFKNGAEILLVGLNKTPDKMRGSTNDLIIVDEAGFCDNLDYVYNNVIIPTTTHRPECRVILSSTPPISPVHEFAHFCNIAEAQGTEIVLTIYDNPMLGDSDIERLARAVGGKDSITFRREYMAELMTDENLQIVREWDDKYWHEVERDKYFQFYHRYVGMDIGVRHLTALIFGYYDFRKAQLIIEDEFDLQGANVTTQNIANLTKSKEAELWGESPVYRRISDNNNLILLQDLSSMHGLHFGETSKDTIEAMVNELRLFVGSGRLAVHPRCVKLRGCLKYGVWDEKSKRNQFAEHKAYGHFDHLAALIYMIRNLDKTTNPVPHDFGMSPYTHHIGKIEKNVSTDVAELAKIFKRQNR